MVAVNIYDKSVISTITDTLLKEYQILNGYTRIVELANALGLNVMLAKFSDDNIAGMLKFENNGVNIYVNANQSANRQRFSIAHEIGHFILHKNLVEEQKINVFYRKDFDNFHDPIEQQANYFAASILMPEEYVKNLYKLLQKNIDSIANTLRVSKQALTYRLLQIGVLDD